MKSRTLKLIAFGVVLFCLCSVLFGFTVSLPGRLEVAQAHWESQNIKNYSYRVRFGSYSALARVLVTVSNGQVTKLEEDQNNPLIGPPTPPNWSPIDANPDWYVRSFSQRLPPDLSSYSVEGLFDFVRDHPQPSLVTCSAPYIYQVHFDSERGYVSELAYTDCPSWDFGVGLLCTSQTIHCFSRFFITDFEALPQT